MCNENCVDSSQHAGQEFVHLQQAIPTVKACLHVAVHGVTMCSL